VISAARTPLALNLHVDDPHPIADAFRLVLNLGLGVATFAVVLVVVHSYAVAWLLARRAHTADPNVPAWRGLLPRHVTLLGVAYLVMVGACMYESFLRLHTPATWRIVVYAVTFAAGLWGLWDVLGYERRQIRDLDGRSHGKHAPGASPRH
jgi:hypothetical protein